MSTPTECHAAASQPAVSSAMAKVAGNADDLRAQMALADAWSDAGCYNDAVGVLEKALDAHPAVPELQTRLRVAKSLVGEEHFFDDLDRVDMQARLKRDVFRCDNLADLDACNEAVRVAPDDPVRLTALGDALMRAKRPQDALQRYQRAAALKNNPALAEKIRVAAAEGPTVSTETALDRDPVNAARTNPVMRQATARRYSNQSPEGQSH